MKKISILPLAEKTEAGEIYTGDNVYHGRNFTYSRRH